MDGHPGDTLAEEGPPSAAFSGAGPTLLDQQVASRSVSWGMSAFARGLLVGALGCAGGLAGLLATRMLAIPFRLPLRELPPLVPIHSRSPSYAAELLGASISPPDPGAQISGTSVPSDSRTAFPARAASITGAGFPSSHHRPSGGRANRASSTATRVNAGSNGMEAGSPEADAGSSTPSSQPSLSTTSTSDVPLPPLPEEPTALHPEAIPTLDL